MIDRAQNEVDDYYLEDIGLDHHIWVTSFVPFAIARLRHERNETEALLTVKLQNVGESGETQRRLRVMWSSDSSPMQPLGVQEHVITEWAACGVACAVLSCYTNVRLRSVAARGDRFDYWVEDGKNEYGLEISGTTTGDLDARHQAKVRQLQQNPYGVDGYTIVVGFANRSVVLSFDQFEEGNR